MWQHEIIEYLIKFDRTPEAVGMLPLVKNAHTFFMGDIHGLSSMEKIAGKTNQPWFYEGPSANRLPFPITMFEYFDILDEDVPGLFKAQNTHADKIFKDIVGQPGRKGKCVLIARQTRDNVILCESLTFNNFENKWRIFPTIIAVKIGSLWNRGEIATESGPVESEGDKGNISLLFRNNAEGIMMQKLCDPSTLMAFDVPRLAVFLMAINCKNVFSEIVLPSDKLNKKRQRNGKQAHLPYRVLKIKAFEVRRNVNNISMGESDFHNRLHFCRGHFKQYLPSKPLLGKYTGLYWWQPHIRGQNKDGFADKDYEIDV